MTTPELSDEAKKEIADAVAIVAADQNSARLRAIHQHLIPPTPENDPPGDGDPTPPPAKDDPEPPADKPKRGLWNVGNRDAG